MAERQLRCPSCDGPMQVADRRGVLIDVCRDCRGVFLDRGELDKLLDAAAVDVGPTDVAPSPPRPQDDEYERRRGSDDEWSDRRDREWEHGHRRRRKGFLDDIFDFG